MEQLIDGDLANNNGGWQWSASTGGLGTYLVLFFDSHKRFTGTDPQPYFRIFNPTLQSEKVGNYVESNQVYPLTIFKYHIQADPDGDLIRRFVPELKHLQGKGK